MLSLELCRCFSDLFLSSRRRRQQSHYYCWVNVEARSVDDAKNAAQKLLDERLRVAVGAHAYIHIEERLKEGPRGFNSSKKRRGKRNKVVLWCPILSVSHIYSS